MYEHPALTGPVQAGLCLTAWNSQGGVPGFGTTPDVTARFDYARFSSITSIDECTFE